MRYILDRYIAKTLCLTIAIVSLLLLGLGILIGLIGELHYLGRGEYGLLQALVFVLLSTPYVLYQLFPMICLIGCLLGLSLLASHRELVCMRANGVSIAHIAGVVAKVALFLILIFTLMGEGFAPRFNQWANDYKAMAKHGLVSAAENYQIWLREGSHFIHIEQASPGPLLIGVSVFAYQTDFKLQAIHYFDKLYYQDGTWHFNHQASTFLHGTHTSTATQEGGTWSTTLSPEMMEWLAVEPEALSLPKLNQYITYLKQNDLRAEPLQRLFWSRMYQPVLTLAMVLIAVPLVFGPLRRYTMGLRLVGGVSLGFAVYLLNEFIGHLSVFLQMPVGQMLLIPSLMVILALVFLMRRVA